MNLRRLLLLGLLALLAVWSQLETLAPTPEPAPSPQARPSLLPATQAKGFTFRLREVESPPVEEPPDEAGTPLPPEEVERILALLPEPSASRAPRDEVVLRPSGPRPPQRHETLAAFPPPRPATRPRPVHTPAPEPLQVRRRAPEGAVPEAGRVEVTFSQDLPPATDAGVRLSPEVPGEWRQVDPRTLRFTPKDRRLPMATAYEVAVPAGLRAASGGRLEREVRWRFRTPPPRVNRQFPFHGTTGLQPTIFLAFDQRIDPKVAGERVRLLDGGRVIPVKPAALPPEIRQDGLRPGTWIAFRPARPLPRDTAFEVRIPAGLPSVEGPLRSTRAFSWGFRTYGPLRMTETGGDWWADFNNPLASRNPAVRIQPALPGMKVAVRQGRLAISGRWRPATEYRISLPADLTDVYGQRLGAVREVTRWTPPRTPSLSLGSDRLLLPPGPKPHVSVYTEALGGFRARVYRMSVTDWAAYEEGEIRGNLVSDRWIAVDAEADREHTPVDLRPALAAGTGQVVVEVLGANHRATCWVQVTTLGLAAVTDPERLLVWATDLREGHPVGGVTVQVGRHAAKTSAEGLAVVPRTGEPDLIVARRGGDVAFTESFAHLWPGKPPSRLAWNVFDDRGVYRPGESVHLKGWLRLETPGPRGGVERAPVREVRWNLRDSRGKRVAHGTSPLTPAGGFSLVAQVPGDAEPSSHDLGLQAVGAPQGVAGTHRTHEVRVEEFRRPEYEATLDSSAAPVVLREAGTLSVSASYLAGGALRNAPVHWRVTTSEAGFAPPGHEGFTFEPPPRTSEDLPEQELDARTDGSGTARAAVEPLGMERPAPVRLSAEASVRDENHQEWTAQGEWLLHPSRCYVGLRSDGLFFEGRPLRVEAVVADLEGKVVPGRPVRLRLLEQVVRDYDLADGKLVLSREVRSAQGAVTVDLPALKPGFYALEAEVTDEAGRPNRSRSVFMVEAGSGRDFAAGLQATLDRPEYEPGQVARLRVTSSLQAGSGLLTIHREGLLDWRTFRLRDGEATLEIPVEEGHFPGLDCRVQVVGSEPASGSLPARPTAAQGSVHLSVSGASRRLGVTVTPTLPLLRPGEETEVAVVVTGADGKPVEGAEVALLAVDEAVLALTGYEVPEPGLAGFRAPLGWAIWGRWWLPHLAEGRYDSLGWGGMRMRWGDGFDAGAEFSIYVAGEYSHSFTRRGDSGLETGTGLFTGFPRYTSVQGLVSEDDGAATPVPGWSAGQQNLSLYEKVPGRRRPLLMRRDFAPLALWEPALRTDASGRVTAKLKLPDSLTRYRLTAVATDGARRFGKGGSTVTARKPLMLRPSPPRFLNLGDRADVPVLVQNLGDRPLDVRLAVRGENASLADGAGRRLTVPPGERRRVSFPVTTDRAGRASLQFAALASDDEDAAEVSLPVLTPAVAESFAAYGQLDGTTVAAVPLLLPKDVFPRFGGLEVTTSATALQDLTDAAVYLQTYPYECSEQIASRLMATLALRDVLKEFRTEGLPAPESLKAAIARDVKRLAARQNSDGGWGFWGGDESWPSLTVHVAQALVLAGDEGGLPYLRDLESDIEFEGESRTTLLAHALAVRARAGEPRPEEARRLLRRGSLSPEAVGWLLQVLGPKAPERRDLLQRVHQAAAVTASSAHVATGTSGEDYLLLESDWRTDAVVLEGLLAADPDSDLIPKLVRGLLDGRVDGRWSNTQDNAYALLALNRYFRVAEGRPPDFTARLWLGDAFVGERGYRGRVARQDRAVVPLASIPAGASEVLVDKTGPGRMYYRIGMRWAPASLELPAADRGFAVERSYEGIDDPADVRRDTDGGWHVRAGARVRVRLRMVNREVRHHVALVDRLPAGLEAQNPELRGQRTDSGAQSEWWHDHEVYRDDRVEAFASSLGAGEHRYSYVARATTKGRFLAPPAGAEEMYRPETFGRSASERVTVE